MVNKRYNSKNAAMLLIDHQVGTAGWMNSGPVEVMKRNTLALAKAAAALGMPVVLTSSMESEAQGSLFPELEDIVPGAIHSPIESNDWVQLMQWPIQILIVR